MDNVSGAANQGTSSEKSDLQPTMGSYLAYEEAHNLRSYPERIKTYLRSYGKVIEVTVIVIWPLGIKGIPLKKSGKNKGQPTDNTKAWIIAADQSNLDEVVADVMYWHRKGFNVYASSAQHNAYWPCEEGETPRPKKPKKDDVTFVVDLRADIDRPGVRIEPLIGDERPPSFGVWSGNGLQPHYRLATPAQMYKDGYPDLEKRAEVEEANVGLSLKYNGDNTQNIDRLGRMPWTINRPDLGKFTGTKDELGNWVKPPRVPTEAKLLWGPKGSGAEMECPELLTYDLSVFERAKPKSQASSSNSRSGGAAEVNFQEGVRPPGENPLEDLDNYPICTQHGKLNGDQIKKWFLFGFDPEQPLQFAKKDNPSLQDRSRWQYYAFSSLIRGGYPVEKAEWLCTDAEFRAENLEYRRQYVEGYEYEGTWIAGEKLMPGHAYGEASDWAHGANVKQAFRGQWKNIVKDVADDPTWAATKLDGKAPEGGQAPQITWEEIVKIYEEKGNAGLWDNKEVMDRVYATFKDAPGAWTDIVQTLKGVRKGLAKTKDIENAWKQAKFRAKRKEEATLERAHEENFDSRFAKAYAREYKSTDKFEIDDDSGYPKQTQRNVLVALVKMGIKFRFNEFANEYLISGFRDDKGKVRGPIVTDELLDDLHETMDALYSLRFIRPLQLMKIILSKARVDSFHPVKEYLESVQGKWDGTPRCETWLIEYAKVKEDPDGYVRAVSRLLLLNAVNRIYHPGAKFDEMMVLEGPQGLGKSSAVLALCPNPDWFSDNVTLGASSKEMIEQTRGKWIIEFAELISKGKTSAGHIKSQLSRATDSARLSYDRLNKQVPRQWVGFGTFNPKGQYLDDPTGARRFWPVEVKAEVDIQAIKDNRDQLWAEALVMLEAGESLRLPRDLWAVAGEIQKTRTVEDPWIGELAQHLGREGDPASWKGCIDTVDIWPLLGIFSPRDMRPEHNSRVTTVMSSLGFRSQQVCISGARPYMWVRGDKTPKLVFYAQVFTDGEPPYQKHASLEFYTMAKYRTIKAAKKEAIKQHNRKVADQVRRDLEAERLEKQKRKTGESMANVTGIYDYGEYSGAGFAKKMARKASQFIKGAMEPEMEAEIPF